jgi:hypothetical protein
MSSTLPRVVFAVVSLLLVVVLVAVTRAQKCVRA